MTTQRTLFSHFPVLQSKLPFIELGTIPTPVQNCYELGDAIGIQNCWIKRDDVSAEDYGGNKIRKLEFLLADAQQKGCSHVITFGAFGSNHVLATALNCKKLGLRCTAILIREPATAAVQRVLRHHLQIGTRLEVANTQADFRVIADQLRMEFGSDNCYEVPFGGSSWLGTVGFVDAGLELALQISAGELPKPDVIYIGCGTAGSTAGLAIAFLLADIKTSIKAIQVVPESFQIDKINERLFNQTSEELYSRDSSFPVFDFGDVDMELRADQLGDGYAMPTTAGREAAQMLQKSGNLPSSLTYTAKVMAALIADARQGKLVGKNVLFWNTYNSHPLPAFPSDDSWKNLPVNFHGLFE